MRAHLALAVLLSGVLSGCGSKSYELQSDGNGNLNFCNAAGVCRGFANPDGCTTLTLVEGGSGDPCQVCASADGSESDCKPVTNADILNVTASDEWL